MPAPMRARATCSHLPTFSIDLRVSRGTAGSTGHKKPLSQCTQVTIATSKEEAQKPADEADGDIAVSSRCSGDLFVVREVEAIGSETPVAISRPCDSSCVLILLKAAVPVPSACLIVLTSDESEAKICVQSGHQGQLVTCSIHVNLYTLWSGGRVKASASTFPSTPDSILHPHSLFFPYWKACLAPESLAISRTFVSTLIPPARRCPAITDTI